MLAKVTDDHIERARRMIGCLDVEQVSQWLATHEADKAELCRLRAGLANHAERLRTRAACVMGGHSKMAPWCVICLGSAARADTKVVTIDDIQHKADCPVTMAAASEETR